MSQESKGSRIADDFPAIAARMRELGAQPRQVAAQPKCGACGDRGWVWSGTVLDWLGCPRCGGSRHHPKPRPRR